MLGRLAGKKIFTKAIYPQLAKALQEANRLRLLSADIMITGQPDGNSWRGVYNGAIAFFPDKVLTIPQVYSTPVFDEKKIETLCFHLINSGFEKIIFSGYTRQYKPFFIALANAKKKLNSDAKIFLIHHSSFTSNREDAGVIPTLKEILELHQKGFIHHIGFIKKGMSETFEVVAGIKSSHLIPMTKKIPDKVFEKTHAYPGLNIGVFTGNHYRKNIDNQVAAALMFPESTVHVHSHNQFDYLFNNERITEHPFSEDYDAFLSLIGSMSVNFYVTLSECFGLFITESLSVGVPCLGALNSGLFDYDEELKSFLVVEEFDNSAAIFKQAEIVVAHREMLSSRGKEYVEKLNQIAGDKFAAFLNS
ncbi:MAG: hypothetical protein ABIQ74_09900 [Chitinophagales bacterium]